MFATRHNEGTRPKDSGPLETLQVPRSGKIPIRPLLYPVFISDLRGIFLTFSPFTIVRRGYRSLSIACPRNVGYSQGSHRLLLTSTIQRHFGQERNKKGTVERTTSTKMLVGPGRKPHRGSWESGVGYLRVRRAQIALQSTGTVQCSQVKSSLCEIWDKSIHKQQTTIRMCSGGQQFGGREWAEISRGDTS